MKMKIELTKEDIIKLVRNEFFYCYDADKLDARIEDRYGLKTSLDGKKIVVEVDNNETDCTGRG